MISAARHRVRWLVCGVFAGAVTIGCAKGAKTPEEAHRLLAEAVQTQDADRLFSALDLETRWSWMSIQRSHRESYDILLSVFPEGPDRQRQLARYEAGATGGSAQALFARTVDPATWARLATAATQSGSATAPVMAGEAEAHVRTSPDRPLVFRRGKDGSWGFAGLADDAEQIKRRAAADLEMLRASAADYERAAARSAK